MKKRLLSAALVLCLLLALLPMAAFADDDVQTGTCGDGLTWTLDAAGTLTVTGSGVIALIVGLILLALTIFVISAKHKKAAN